MFGPSARPLHSGLPNSARGGSDFASAEDHSPDATSRSADVDWGAAMTTNGNALRVLVVDDDADTADSLAVLVQMWGHEVHTAYNGTAINAVPVFKPDVIVLDIGLPKLDGNGMAKRVRAQACYDGTLIIAVTGYHDEARRLLSREAGIDHYLIKPVDPRVLEALLLVKANAKRADGGG